MKLENITSEGCVWLAVLVLRDFECVFILFMYRKLLETIMGKLHTQRGGIMMTSMNISGLSCQKLITGLKYCA